MDCFGLPMHFVGICVERKIDLGNAILAGLGVIGLISIWLAFRQFKLVSCLRNS